MHSLKRALNAVVPEKSIQEISTLDYRVWGALKDRGYSNLSENTGASVPTPSSLSLGLKSHLDSTHWVWRALGIQELELMITIRGHIIQPAVQ